MGRVTTVDIGIGTMIIILMLILYQGDLFEFKQIFGVVKMEER